MYEELALVSGKDIATGTFAKSFADIDVQEVDSNPTEVELQSFDDVVRDKQVSSNAPSSKERPHRKRARKDDSSTVDKVAEQLGKVAVAIKKLSQNQLCVEDLYNKVMKTEGFNEIFLGSVFDYLIENERQAKAFMVKNENLRRVWIENFMVQQHNDNRNL